MNTSITESSEFLGHPKGLFVCFATEMWERFSYYGMRALLILYLTKHWEFSDAQSYVIYGAYTSLVYIMPVFGGMLADRIAGNFVAGLIARATASEGMAGGENIFTLAQKSAFVDVYTNVGLIAVAVGLLLAICSPFLKKGMHGIN